VTDADTENATYSDPANQLLLTREGMIWFWDHYAPDQASRTNPDASSIHAPEPRNSGDPEERSRADRRDGCAGVRGVRVGVDNLTESHLERMRERLAEFEANLRAGNVTAAGGADADFSTIVILASGNRELQTHVDLVVARTLRLLALTADSDAWRVWTQGYRETLDLLEADDRPGAVARYRQIFVEYRTVVENMLFAGENNQS
jgi:hypothetical protein